MFIDIHVHTSRYSSCGRGSPEEMARAAIAAGLDAIVFTEHHVLWPENELRELRRAYPELRIFSGTEVTTKGGKSDILLLGISEEYAIEKGLPADVVMRRVHESGGTGVLAHPFRLSRFIPGELLITPPDAYEIMSLNMPPFARKAAITLEGVLPAHPLVASDAHNVAGLGAYGLLLDEEVANERELAAAIRSGEFRLVVDERRLRERAPHWQRIQERVESLVKAGASYRKIRQETEYTGEIVRYIMAGGSLLER